MQRIDNPNGNYRFLTGIAPYSAGVVAMPGYEIIHATLRQPLPYRVGFDLIDQHLAQLERPRQALCAIELRSPTLFTFDGFLEFNNGYQDLLAERELLFGKYNPIARTNIAPQVDPPAVPSLFGFSYTVPTATSDTTFVVAGAGDLHDQADLRAERIVRAQETSSHALREKASVVMAVMQARLFGLQMAWPDVTVFNIYTVLPIAPILLDTIVRPTGSAAGRGVHWHYSHPPIEGLAFEMDLRGVHHEQWV